MTDDPEKRPYAEAPDEAPTAVIAPADAREGAPPGVAPDQAPDGTPPTSEEAPALVTPRDGA